MSVIHLEGWHIISLETVLVFSISLLQFIMKYPLIYNIHILLKFGFIHLYFSYF